MSNGSSDYHAGMSDAQIKNLMDDIGEIKVSMAAMHEAVDRRFDKMETKVDDLGLYRAKVSGIALAVSTMVTIGWNVIKQIFSPNQ